MNAPVKGEVSRRSVPSYLGGGGGDGQGGAEFDLRAILRVLRKRTGVIVGVTAILTGLAALIVLQLTPLYSGTVTVLIDGQRTQIVDMEAVMSGISLDTVAIESQVQVLRSRSLIERVVERENLAADPEFNPFLRERSVFDWLSVSRLTKVVAEMFAAEDGAGTADTQVHDFASAETRAVVNSLLSRMTVLRRPGSFVIDISFASEYPQKAARIANAIAEAYVLDQLDARLDATKQASEWLSQRLAQLRTQVGDAERAVELYRSEHGLEAAGGITVSEQQLSELNAQLILARTSLVEARAKYDRAQQIRRQGGSIESVADVLQSGTISNLRQKQAELTRERANLSATYGPRHPAIVNIEAQQEDIGRQIGAEVNRIIESIRNNVSVAETRVRALEQSLADIKGDAGVDNQALIQLRELERQAAANRAVYESFLNRYQETTQQQGLQTPDTRVISEAVVPGSSSYPRVGFFIGTSFLLSLLIGVGLAILLEHLDDGIQTGKQAEELLGLPHLVSLPAVPAEKGSDGKVLLPQDYLLVKPLSAFAESLRSLRSALHLSNVDVPPKIILFTSALPNEGKTTTATSFARAAAVSGLRVILIDCDLRHPSVHKAFGVSRPDLGLVELLAERLDPDAVLFKDAKSDLDVIPVATGTANPPDVLGSAQMKALLKRLHEAYDLVVLDSAPLMPVSDSRVLSQLADETVFVVRWNTTPSEAAQNAIKILAQYESSVAGVVIAAVDMEKQAKYGYGDGGYYYGHYSKYYVN